MGNLFLAVGIAELSNKMVSQATSDRVFVIKPLYFRVVITLLWRTVSSRMLYLYCIIESQNLTVERFKETGIVYVINVRKDITVLHLRKNLSMQCERQ